MLEGDALKDMVIGYAEQTMDDIVQAYINPELPPEEWKLSEMVDKVKEFVYLLSDLTPEQLEDLSVGEIRTFLHEQARIAYDIKEAQVDQIKPGLMRESRAFLHSAADRQPLGATTCSRWMPCGKPSVCAATARKIP